MDKKNNIFFRMLQSLPGFVSWFIIIGAIILILLKPVVFVFIIIIFSIYWVTNCIRIVINASFCYNKIQKVSGEDWLEKLKNDFPDDWESYYYCALIPFASESINVLKPTIDSIANSNFPGSKKILCLSSEKAISSGKAISEYFKENYNDKFAHIFITEHELKPGEMKGKSSNQNHCGRYVYKELIDLGIDPEKVLISSNDSDVLNDKQYHAYLIHKFLSQGDNKHYHIYQPIPTDFTEYWDAKFFSRIIIMTGALWRMALQQLNNYRCTVYAFYSMSLKTLHDINFWDVDLIPEDERTMFKALFKFGKLFKVIPLYITTSGNPIKGKSLIDTFIEQYKQIRRWAWGASEFAYSVQKAMTIKKFDHKVVLLPILNQLRVAAEWSLSSIMLMFGGFLPGILNPSFNKTELAHVYPIILSSILSITSFLILVIIFYEFKFIPKKPKDQNLFSYLKSVFQWIALPIVGLLLSSIPALEAQTRLILNLPIAYIESKKE